MDHAEYNLCVDALHELIAATPINGPAGSEPGSPSGQLSHPNPRLDHVSSATIDPRAAPDGESSTPKLHPGNRPVDKYVGDAVEASRNARVTPSPLDGKSEFNLNVTDKGDVSDDRLTGVLSYTEPLSPADPVNVIVPEPSIDADPFACHVEALGAGIPAPPAPPPLIPSTAAEAGEPDTTRATNADATNATVTTSADTTRDPLKPRSPDITTIDPKPESERSSRSRHRS